MTTVKDVEIAKIRRDGGTQVRRGVDPVVVQEYAELMAAGAEFPGVRLWFDGESYWLSDGFHRVAAAESLGLVRIRADVLEGSLAAAQWDSLASNTTHGLRRSRADLLTAVERAFAHPQAVRLSNVQIAKHLGMPESTLRRLRKAASSPEGEPTLRVAIKGGRPYSMDTSGIGKNHRSNERRKPSLRRLASDLDHIKGNGSAEAQRLANVLRNWIFGGANWTDCLVALEKFAHARGMGPSAVPSPKAAAKG